MTYLLEPGPRDGPGLDSLEQELKEVGGFAKRRAGRTESTRKLGVCAAQR